MKFYLSRLLILVITIQLIASAAVDGRVLINEVHINPPGGDDARFQYVEILTVNNSNVPHAESLDGLSLLFIDSNGGSVGNVEEVLNLSGLSTGANGLLLIGQDYDTSNPWEGTAQDTAIANFAAIKGIGGLGSIGPKNGMTVLLVEGFTGKPLDDLDGDDDGDLGQDPWNQILDSIGYGDLPFETRLILDFAPDNLSRSAANLTQNTTRAWYGGDILNTTGFTSLSFERPFGPFTGTATPGAPNQSPPAENPIRLNEVLINPPRSDANIEFIELISTTGGITATNNLWLLIVDSDRDGAQGGVVLEAWNLSGQATGTNGLLLLGNNYSQSNTPWKDVISSETSFFDPDNNSGGSSMGDEDIGPNGAFTVLLVEDFAGVPTVGDVMGTDLDTNDDGVLDARPWDTSVGDDGILDSVGFDQRNDQTGDVLWKTYALGNVTQYDNISLTEPDALTRNPNNMSANTGAAWMGGNIGGDSETGIAYRPGATYFGEFLTVLSPGNPNPISSPAQSLILFNEVHLNPPGNDANFEYIELISPRLTSTALLDLSLLVVDVSGLATGEIKNVIDLRGLSTGPTGYVVLGDSYNDPPGVYPIPSDVHAEDPPGLNLGEIGPNNDLALLIVEGFTGIPTDDLDIDNDGHFDVMPWSAVLDGVGFGSEFFEDVLVANLNGVGMRPDSICRIPFHYGQFDPTAWYGGKIAGEVSTTLTYVESFGPFVGAATPGRVNLSGPRRADAILFNELNINPPGGDGRFEFIELISASGARQSTDGISVIVLENSGARGGDIEFAWSLDGLSTGTNGLLLIGDDYPPISADGFPINYWDRSLDLSLAPNLPFTEFNSKVSATGDPLKFNADGLGPNDSLTIMLVRDFYGEIGQDLDADDNGILDVFPWDTNVGILDSIGFNRYDDSLTPPTFDGFPYTAADVSQKTYVPDTVARHVGNFSANSLAAWFGGAIAGSEPSGLSYSADNFGLQGVSGAVTPGLPNGGSSVDSNDDDNDGVSNESEAIAGTDPLDNTDFLRITTAARNAEGVYLEWTSVAGKSYVIEYSNDLVSWSVVSNAPIAGQIGISSYTVTTQQPAVGFYRSRVVP